MAAQAKAKEGVTLDLTTQEGVNKAFKDLEDSLQRAERAIRESRHAMVAVHLANIHLQLASGLLTTQEAINSCKQKVTSVPCLWPGDLDYITGLRVKAPVTGLRVKAPVIIEEESRSIKRPGQDE